MCKGNYVDDEASLISLHFLYYFFIFVLFVLLFSSSLWLHILKRRVRDTVCIDNCTPILMHLYRKNGDSSWYLDMS